MDITLPTALLPPTDIGASLHAPHTPATPPVAPPELVSKFEALMAGAGAPGGANPDTPLISKAAVVQVESHLQQHAAAIAHIAELKPGEVNLAEMQVLQMQMSVQLGMMSLTQAAYFQVLGSAKSSVSALMKNQ
jgi:hypothetical protein